MRTASVAVRNVSRQLTRDGSSDCRHAASSRPAPGRRGAGWSARPRSAMSCSWVISTIVRPSACRSSSRPRTSAVERRVEVAGRLVGQDHRRLGDERPGDGDALLLAARQLAGPVVGPVGEPDLLERLQARARGARRRRRRRRRAAARRCATPAGTASRLNCWNTNPMKTVADVGELVLVEGLDVVAGEAEDARLVGTSRQPRMCISVDLPGAGRADDGDELAFARCAATRRAARRPRARRSRRPC